MDAVVVIIGGRVTTLESSLTFSPSVVLGSGLWAAVVPSDEISNNMGVVVVAL